MKIKTSLNGKLYGTVFYWLLLLVMGTREGKGFFCKEKIESKAYREIKVFEMFTMKWMPLLSWMFLVVCVE